MLPENQLLSPEKGAINSSAVISLITNYKKKTVFEAILDKNHHEKGIVYLKVGDEDFIIDLEENDVMTSLFSEKEIGKMIAELVVDNLRMETNLRIASRILTADEMNILELSAKGYSSQELYSKTGIPPVDITSCKQSIYIKLKKDSFEEAIDFVRQKRL